QHGFERRPWGRRRLASLVRIPNRRRSDLALGWPAGQLRPLVGYGFARSRPRLRPGRAPLGGRTDPRNVARPSAVLGLSRNRTRLRARHRVVGAPRDALRREARRLVGPAGRRSDRKILAVY